MVSTYEIKYPYVLKRYYLDDFKQGSDNGVGQVIYLAQVHYVALTLFDFMTITYKLPIIDNLYVEFALCLL